MSRATPEELRTRHLEKVRGYPVRLCYSLHHCFLCDQGIIQGESYYDGGYGLRAHVVCVQKEDAKQ